MVNTVILMEAEKAFLWRNGLKFHFTTIFKCRWIKEELTYWSRSPSNTMVRKMLNLLRTVNMGKLRQEAEHRETRSELQTGTNWASEGSSVSLESLRPKQPRYLVPCVEQRQREHLQEKRFSCGQKVILNLVQLLLFRMEGLYNKLLRWFSKQELD